MNIYKGIFINHYNFSSRITEPDRITSIYCVSLVQSMQFYAIWFVIASKISNKIHPDQIVFVGFVVSILFMIFNSYNYSESKAAHLLSEYQKLDKKQKNKIRATSILVSLLSTAILLLSVSYCHNLYIKNIKS